MKNKQLIKRLYALASALPEVHFDDPRPRNAQGQFDAPQASGVDPITMKHAYNAGRDDQKAGNLTRGMIGAGLATAGAIAAHRLGKSTGMGVGRKWGRELAKKAYKVGRKTESKIANREIEGLGATFHRTQAMNREVASENQSFINAQQGEHMKHVAELKGKLSALKRALRGGK